METGARSSTIRQAWSVSSPSSRTPRRARPRWSVPRTPPVPIEVVEGTAEKLPAADGEFDAAVLMGIICSVRDPAAALRELQRVLRPGGELRFWEHVRSGNTVFRGAAARDGRALLDAGARRLGDARDTSAVIGAADRGSSDSSEASTRRRSSRSRQRRTFSAPRAAKRALGLERLDTTTGISRSVRVAYSS